MLDASRLPHSLPSILNRAALLEELLELRVLRRRVHHRLELRLHRREVPSLARGGVQRRGVPRGEAEQVQGGGVLIRSLRGSGGGGREQALRVGRERNEASSASATEGGRAAIVAAVFHAKRWRWEEKPRRGETGERGTRASSSEETHRGRRVRRGGAQLQPGCRHEPGPERVGGGAKHGRAPDLCRARADAVPTNGTRPFCSPPERGGSFFWRRERVCVFCGLARHSGGRRVSVSAKAFVP